MIDQWIKEIKEQGEFKDLGMFLAHSGVVRATSKDGKPVQEMQLSYDKGKLADLMNEMSRRDGIVSVRVWINEGFMWAMTSCMHLLRGNSGRMFSRSLRS